MKNTDLDALQRARADLETTNAAMRELEESAKMLRLAISYLEAATKGAPEPPAIRKPDAVVPAEGAPKRTKEMSASEFCEAIVAEEGPTEMAEFYEAMMAARYELSGKDENGQKSTLAGYLARVGILKHYKEYGRWWYADKPYPAKRRGFFDVSSTP